MTKTKEYQVSVERDEDGEVKRRVMFSVPASPAGVKPLEWVEGIESAPYATTVLAGFFDREYGDWVVQLFVAERPTSPFTHWMLVLSPDEASARIMSAIEPAGVGVEMEAKHPIVAASRVYEVLKKYRDQGRFDWDYIGYICRDIAAIKGDEQ